MEYTPRTLELMPMFETSDNADDAALLDMESELLTTPVATRAAFTLTLPLAPRLSIITPGTAVGTSLLPSTIIDAWSLPAILTPPTLSLLPPLPLTL
jgi:hypothetical protein